MTPYQLKLCWETHRDNKIAEYDRQASLMWHGAMIGRVKKPPAFEDFMINKKKVLKIDERAIMERLKAYQSNPKKDK